MTGDLLTLCAVVASGSPHARGLFRQAATEVSTPIEIIDVENAAAACQAVGKAEYVYLDASLPGDGCAQVISAVRAAVTAAGRSIDEDHYGAAFPFRFGRQDDAGLARVMEAYQKRTGRDPLTYFAIGDAAIIISRIAAYIEAGASKFILRPIGRGDDDLLEQTRRLIEEVLPAVKQRWPKAAFAA